MKYIKSGISILFLSVLFLAKPTHADTQNYLVICAPEYTPYNLHFITPTVMTINGGSPINYRSYFAFVVGDPISGNSLVWAHGSDNTDTTMTIFGWIIADVVWQNPAEYVYKTGIQKVKLTDPTPYELVTAPALSCYKKLNQDR